jgi:ankyrin repeat protein
MLRFFALFLALLHCDLSRGAEQANPDKALADACRMGSVDDAKAALQRGANPNALSPEEEPVLHAALYNGEPKLVQLLLKSGAKADLADSLGRTALHAAAGAYAGNESKVQEQNLRAILATGVDVRRTDRYGDDALVPAARRSAAMVRILLDAGAKVSPAAVESAVMSYEFDSLDVLIKAGGDLHAPLKKGRTMMHAAVGGWVPAWDKGEEVVRMLEILQAAGLKVDVPDAEGMTPLLVAAAHGNRGAVQWLAAHGANIKATDNAGRTALLVALEDDDEESLVYAPLIAAGCPLDAVSQAKMTALDTAIFRRWWNTAHLLLRRGAVPRDAVKDLREALAVWRESPASPAATRGIFHRLLSRIPDARALSAGGFPLLREIIFIDEPSLLKAALRKGADVNARDERGRTALMWASLTELKAALTLLRAAGADDSLRDTDGKSAADLAALFHQPPPPPPPAPPAGPPSPPADLFDAVAIGDGAAVEKFVAADKSSLKAERLGLHPIHLAALNNHPGIAELLIKLGVDPEMKSPEGLTPFAYAAAAGHVEWCRWFIERAADAARPALLKEAAAAAIGKGRSPALAAEMLRAGWKPDTTEAQSLLLLAVNANDLLLTRAAIPFCHDTFPRGEGDPFAGGQPCVLDTAAGDASREVMQCLLSATAAKQPEAWRANVNGALETAIRRNNLPAFELLLATNLIEERPAIEGQADKKAARETPLFQAVGWGRTRMVQALLAKGHKPAPGDGLLGLAMRGGYSQGPLDPASNDGYSDLIPLLLKAGASVDDADKEGFTALHMAAARGDEEAARVLRAAGASLTKKANDGQTATELADEAGFPDLAEELKARAAAK